MENGPGKGAAGQKTMATARRSGPDSELSKENGSSPPAENVIWSEKSALKHPGWPEWQHPIFFSLAAIAVGFVMLLWFKSQMLLSKKKDCEEPESMTEDQDKIVSQTSNTTVAAVVSEEVSSHCWKLQATSTAVQETCVAEAQLPEALRQSAVVAGPSTSTAGGGTRFASEVRPEPIRIKAKGLLERRGSSASLTIDLHPSQENISTLCGPTRECTTDEYLLSAGNMLSRQQLRKCLEDVNALHREFWEIPSNYREHLGVAGAGFKNRYKSILPNERTRVQISPPCLGMAPGSAEDQLACYINANYIRGYDGEDKAYIATQGPLPNTIADFWLMVWGEGVPVIVMITRFVETCKCKCEPYIPMNPQDDGDSPPDSPSMAQSLGGPGSTEKYGEVTVTVEKVSPRDGYVVRELRVQRGDETRIIQHYWYDTWPDHKTPDTAKSIVELVREVEAFRQKSLSQLRKQYGDNVPRKAPVVVHCSAGIGRTGCFLAVAIGTIQLAEENNVDVLGIVCRLRHDRGGMVQTAEQYEFIHRALSEFEKTLPNRSGEDFERTLSKSS
ncbi:tyrosine-protein phosphatase non-receptor type 5-like [Thrips palmi]|uniref:protein-tyrosine-phosphatase n=1 Tax=Thrips palmi TaxID=161013 RepID=A0A6P8YAI9_THRPL|nr:tyrosine-protein phosphatase non-receptor type 5-like [Thrips palmi]XP_034233754.1 tyrosine-protein phosphatase non-receptor type 5-like [Thrips palmi]XP_034233755.1 tyrosine-protein phosphatase non-receptor type 5-like [Thrips palmi]XP_034233756.1 tyrosine-protein phosphatase non-receptor type 5-like [Thrips palmi]